MCVWRVADGQHLTTLLLFFSIFLFLSHVVLFSMYSDAMPVASGPMEYDEVNWFFDYMYYELQMEYHLNSCDFVQYLSDDFLFESIFVNVAQLVWPSHCIRNARIMVLAHAICMFWLWHIPFWNSFFSLSLGNNNGHKKEVRTLEIENRLIVWNEFNFLLNWHKRCLHFAGNYLNTVRQWKVHLTFSRFCSGPTSAEHVSLA